MSASAPSGSRRCGKVAHNDVHDAGTHRARYTRNNVSNIRIIERILLPLPRQTSSVMLRNAWRPIAATGVVGASGYAFYRYYYARNQTFELPVKSKGEDGKVVMTNKTLRLLPMSEVDARVREHASEEARPRPSGIVWKHTTATLASNNPIEDANASQVIARDPEDPSGPGDWLFYTVMDGHGGYETSQLLSRVLINAVALELSSLIPKPKTSTQSSYLRSIWPTSSPTTPAISSDSNPSVVSEAIQNAFKKLDSELINAPLRVLANNMDGQSFKDKKIPDLSQHPMALQTMLPAISGSCALMALFDTAHRNLYVACTGDSRAVAGVWEPTDDGKGSWRIEVLSEDQTGRNPSEIQRVQAEHPGEQVVREGRILGGLEPSRAFGDARYKWPREVQEVLGEAFLAGNGRLMRPPPSSFKTPPYVTAQPVVKHHKLSLPPWITHGLWDQLSNDDVVKLVGGHLAGVKGTVSKSELSSRVPTSTGSLGVEGKNKKRKDGEGSWAFVDDNLSTHLIRNAFGGGDEGKLRWLLSIPAPYSRRYRDDITVTVVWWEDGREQNAQTASFTADKPKAKL
ncbi:hypothetical protein EYR38_005847 [Pleurotus pulmonarius]|nr:hypothetical protein EYR38_005847 [Pleurotus pulmonarius]